MFGRGERRAALCTELWVKTVTGVGRYGCGAAQGPNTQHICGHCFAFSEGRLLINLLVHSVRFQFHCVTEQRGNSGES